MSSPRRAGTLNSTISMSTGRDLLGSGTLNQSSNIPIDWTDTLPKRKELPNGILEIFL